MTKSQVEGLPTLLLMPSFYGALAWAFWLTLYELRFIEWEPAPAIADTIYLTVLAFYLVSTAMWYGSYRAWHERKDFILFPPASEVPGNTPSARWYLGLLHALGFVGFVLYVRDFAGALGGVSMFAQLLVGASWVIRRQAEVTASVGTQLSYFGWIAIALTWLEYRRGRVRGVWLVLAGVQLLANLLYIDRTRPTTILFTTALVALVAAPVGRTKLIAFRAAALAVVVGVLFVVVATWIGKVAVEGQYRTSSLPLWAQNVYYYGTGGFAYFSHLVGSQESISYSPERAFYPALKALSAVGLAAPPPSQVLDYYSAPFPTNVGTFLEPFYQDGGLAFAFTAIVIHSLGLDALGLALLRSGHRLAIFGWANLCFVTCISFFTPKITGFPTWLFTALAIAALLWRGTHDKAFATPRVVPAQGGG